MMLLHYNAVRAQFDVLLFLLPLYRNITLSDPLPQNREVQEHYMAQHGTDERFIEHYKLTAQLEGNVDKWTDVRSRLRYYSDS